MTGFGAGLTTRAASLAKDAVRRVGEAMIAAAEGELPRGVEITSDPEGVALSGRRLRSRYWGTALRPADPALRLALERVIERRRG